MGTKHAVHNDCKGVDTREGENRPECQHRQEKITRSPPRCSLQTRIRLSAESDSTVPTFPRCRPVTHRAPTFPPMLPTCTKPLENGSSIDIARNHPTHPPTPTLKIVDQKHANKYPRFLAHILSGGNGDNFGCGAASVSLPKQGTCSWSWRHCGDPRLRPCSNPPCQN